MRRREVEARRGRRRSATVLIPRSIATSLRFPNPRTSWGGPLPTAGAVVADAVKPDRSLPRALDYRRLIGAVRQVRNAVEAGIEAAQRDLGSMNGEGADEHVASRRVDRSHAAQMPVKATGLDQPGERELLEHGRAAVAEQLVLGYGLEQRRADRRPTRGAAPAPATC